MSKNLNSFYYLQQLMHSLPFHFASFRFIDEAFSRFHRMKESSALWQHDEIYTEMRYWFTHLFFRSKKGYNAKSLPVVVLIFDGFQPRYSENTFHKNIIMKSWHGDGAALPSRCCMLHITNTAHCCCAMNMYMYVYFTTGPLRLPLALHPPNDPYYSNQNCYMQQQQQQH